MNPLAGFPRNRPLAWPWTLLLLVALLLAVAYFVAAALPYFFDAKVLIKFGYARRFPLFVHIVAAGLALLVGPVQLWMGFTGRYVLFHRKLGMLYLASIVIACVPGFYLAGTTQRGRVFAFGLGSLLVAWLITAGLAYTAVLRHQYIQHREWMVRTYVMTFAFVTFRLLVVLLKALKIGTSPERINIAAWLSWVGPLFLAEAIIQGQKIFAARRLTLSPSQIGDTARPS